MIQIIVNEGCTLISNVAVFAAVAAAAAAVFNDDDDDDDDEDDGDLLSYCRLYYKTHYQRRILLFTRRLWITLASLNSFRITGEEKQINRA